MRGSSFKATADGFAAAGCFVTSYSDGGPGLSFAGGSVSAPACNYHGVDTSADSLSSADLASGVLRAAAHSVGVHGGGGVGGAGGGAMIMDTITFSAPTLSSFFGNATLSVNYSIVANDIPPDCSNVARIQAGLQFGLVGDPQPATSLFSTSIPDCSGIGPPSAMITLSTGTLTMFDGQQWEISSTLGVGTTVTASADASNTAHVSINLPPGVKAL